MFGGPPPEDITRYYKILGGPPNPPYRVNDRPAHIRITVLRVLYPVPVPSTVSCSCYAISRGSAILVRFLCVNLSGQLTGCSTGLLVNKQSQRACKSLPAQLVRSQVQLARFELGEGKIVMNVSTTKYNTQSDLTLRSVLCPPSSQPAATAAGC